jgi:hypothetical protein
MLQDGSQQEEEAGNTECDQHDPIIRIPGAEIADYDSDKEGNQGR